MTLQDLHEDLVIKIFLNRIAGIRKQIQQILLYGSRARGDEKPYSDYDLLIVVEKRERPLVDAVHDAVMDALIETGRLITPQIYSQSDFNRWSKIPTPFFKNVLREGIPLG